MWKCAVCKQEIEPGNRHYNLNSAKVCAYCARTLTLEEISFSDDALDCAVVDTAVPVTYELKA